MQIMAMPGLYYYVSINSAVCYILFNIVLGF